jgi:hypothetical protein
MNDASKLEHFSPKEFLKSRRPEKFSDSWVDEQNALNRSQLEYHLDTITSRMQENQFEEFGRALAEKEICPNLVSQTGPMGGGDSKADTETYPVADDLSIAWYVGIGRESSSERWAFAVSAQKTWGDKVRSDVASIVGTQRGYRKIFFISSRFVRSKDRAATEDELTQQYGVEVRILDRTWILDKIFANQREDLAIEKLAIPITPVPTTTKGPLDLRRDRDLQEIEGRIAKMAAEKQYSLRLADESLAAADLSRRLEKPRIETDGRYERAERIILKCGLPHQFVRCAYDRAQTAFWWYEDYAEFCQLYMAMEARTRGGWNVYEFELLVNLWLQLHGLAQRRQSDVARSSYEQATVNLLSELNRLASEQDRPSSIAQAKTLRLLIQIFREMGNSGALTQLLSELNAVIGEAETLIGYPIESLINLLAELEDVLDTTPGYQELFRKLVKRIGARKSDIAAAQMLVKSGLRQLRRDHPKSAISSLGMALGGLYKEESRQDVIKALYLCGIAYERLGLFWAARGSLLVASSLATDDLFNKGELSLTQLGCYRRLKWIELQLGRTGQTLTWHELEGLLAVALSERDVDVASIENGDEQFDSSLALLFLKTDFWELKQIRRLPDTLEQMNLPLASIALLYAIGDAPDQWGDDGTGRSFEDQFKIAREKGLFDQLPERPLFYEQQKVEMTAHLLGCKIMLSAENKSPCVEIGESLLAALEATFATCKVTEIVAQVPSCTIRIRQSQLTGFPFEFQVTDKEGWPHIEIQCLTFSPDRLTPDQADAIKTKIVECLCTVVGHVLSVNGPVEEFFHKLFGDELALQRAVSFTGSFVTVGNVLGASRKDRISAWLLPESKEYQIRRSVEWDRGLPIRNADASGTSVQRDAQLSGVDEDATLKHSQIEVVSLIRARLWERASWDATAYAVSPSPDLPPMLAPVFRNKSAATEIFALWRRELGERDEDEMLRVSIITGVDAAYPFSYRVLIGTAPKAQRANNSIQRVVLPSRINRMTPSSDFNLRRFKDRIRRSPEYLLVPAVYTGVGDAYTVLYEHRLSKAEIHFRNAWEIGLQDPDNVAIYVEDDPIIPEGASVPPVRQLLELKRRKHHQ